MTTSVTRWTRSRNPGNGRCCDCGRVTWMSKLQCTFIGDDGKETGLCERCYDRAGLENEHRDGAHDEFPALCVTECPLKDS